MRFYLITNNCQLEGNGVNSRNILELCFVNANFNQSGSYIVLFVQCE